MQVAGYIFLDRNWETDQDHIDRILSYFVELESKPNILFFPEGILLLCFFHDSVYDCETCVGY